MENLVIRQETTSDHEAVFNVTEAAFRNLEVSDQTEHFLVERLRKSDAFVPELSLVAEYDGLVMGHILLTRVRIGDSVERFPALTLAPVSVHPDFQGRGIGGALTREAYRVAKQLGFTIIVLVGHPNYDPRFGYRVASKYGITFPFDTPDEACMLVELQQGVLEQVEGVVLFPEVFYK